MAKKVEEKNKKAVKAPAKKVEAKKVAAKKTETKKVVTKKVEAKKADVKPAKKVETKKIEKKGICNKLLDNTPFVVALCACILLLGALVISLIHNRIPTTKDGNEIVASVKGKKVTADDLYKELKDASGYAKLFEVIDNYIAKKEVGNDISKEDEEYVQGVVDYYKEYAEYYGTDFASFLRDYVGLSNIETEDEFYDFVLEDYKKTIALEKYVGEKATNKEIKEYYKNNYSETFTARHILIQVNEDTDEKTAKETAKKVIKKLNEAKDVEKTFKELVEEYSDDTGTYSNGGLVENFAKADVVEGFYEATAKLKDGKYTKEPVKTEYGYHVILRVSSKEAKPLKEIKDEVVRAYAKSQIEADANLSTLAWDELRSKYNFKLNDDAIKKTYKENIKAAKGEPEETKTEE